MFTSSGLVSLRRLSLAEPRSEGSAHDGCAAVDVGPGPVDPPGRPLPVELSPERDDSPISPVQDVAKSNANAKVARRIAHTRETETPSGSRKARSS